MVKSISKIIEDFIQSIDFSQAVESYTVNVDSTAIYIGYLLHLRKDMTVDIDGQPHKVLSVNQSGYFTIKSTIITPLIVTIPTPYFIHGTPLAVNVELGTLRSSVKAPLIYLYEIINDIHNTDPTSSIDREPSLVMFYLDNMNPSWLTGTSYEKVLDGIRNLVAFVEEKILNSPLFEGELIKNISYYEHAVFGKFITEKGHVSTVFDEYLAGIEQRITLPIKHNLICS